MHYSVVPSVGLVQLSQLSASTPKLLHSDAKKEEVPIQKVPWQNYCGVFATNRVAQGLDCVLVLEALESGRRPVIPKVTSTHCCGAVRCQGELRSLLYNREQSSGREGGGEETNSKPANNKFEISTLTVLL